jgi:hypothetical protein
MPSKIKTPSFRTPRLHEPRRVSITTRKQGLRNALYNRASLVKKRLGNLYTNASFVLYTADERIIYEAKQRHGNKYLIKLFPNYPKLVLQEFETVTLDNFNDLYSPFVQKFQSKLPDIGKTLRTFREMSLKNKRLKRYMDEDPSSIRAHLDEYEIGVIELEQTNEAYAARVKRVLESVRNQQSASNVFFRGTRRNGTFLVPEQSGPGRIPLSKIQSFLGKIEK